jgi:hypothetical protein
MLRSLKNLFNSKVLALAVSKSQKEMLELLMMNKGDFEKWAEQQSGSKIRLHFFYPTAIDFYFDAFKLFTAYYKKNRKGEIELQEMKMSEVNYDSIRCTSWAPFEEVVIDFLTTMEESKKIDLFEKRKTLFEYQSLCTKTSGRAGAEHEYAKAISASPLQLLKPTQ